MNPIAFDIETAPQPGVLDTRFAPEFEPYVYQSWDPSKVKRLKSDTDETYQEKYVEAQGEHLRIQDEKKAEAEAKFKKKQEDFLDDCCLHPHLGMVKAIGLYDGSNFKALEGSEFDMLQTFWLQFTACTKRQQVLVGHYCMDFDLPFMINRSRAIGVKVPGAVVVRSGKYWNWCQVFEDTCSYWLMGRYKKDVKSSLDALCHAFGLAGKQVEGVEGKGWWRIYETNRELAIEYLRNDCVMTYELYQRLVPLAI